MTDIFLYQGEPAPADVRLRDPTAAPAATVEGVAAAAGTTTADFAGNPLAAGDGSAAGLTPAADFVAAPTAGAVAASDGTSTAAATAEWIAEGVAESAGTAAALATGEGPGGVEVPVVEEPPTGGWLAENVAAAERQRRRQQQELDELRAEADRLEAHLVETGVIEPPAEVARLEGLVAEYRQYPLPNKIRRAIDHAERAGTMAALILAERQIRRLEEEEDFAVLMALALDD